MPKGSKAELERKRRIIARGLVAGRKTAAIAKSAGCTVRHVERVAAQDQTRFLVEQMFKPYRRKLAMLAEKAITAVSVALVAKQTDKADHMARLRAVGRFKQLCEMAEGAKPEVTEKTDQTVTWEEFVVLYRRRNGQVAGAVSEDAT